MQVGEFELHLFLEGNFCQLQLKSSKHLDQLVKIITYDNGTENVLHQEINFSPSSNVVATLE